MLSAGYVTCYLQEQNLNVDCMRAEGRVAHTLYNPWVVI